MKVLRRVHVFLMVVLVGAVAMPAVVEAQYFKIEGISGNMEEGTQWVIEQDLQLDELGRFHAELEDRVNEDFSTENIVLSGSINPTISASFDVVNNLASTQNYTFVFEIFGIVPQLPLTFTGGSTGITVTDVNGDGVTLGGHPNLRPTYFSQIDGVDHVSLDLAPISAGSFLSDTNSDAFGVPIPSLLGPAATNSIGIRYDFTLTPGDRAAVTGVFVVVRIPEPASIILIAIGMLPLAVWRRRRI